MPKTRPTRQSASHGAKPAIEDYAAIGNCRSIALVSRWGSIDWWCQPHFSSPSIFAALLDSERGGCFAISPRGQHSTDQRYEPHTNVLRTRFECAGGVLELVDFMTLPATRGESEDGPVVQRIVRIVTCTSGTIELDLRFEPRPDYARERPQWGEQGAGIWRALSSHAQLELSTSLPLERDQDTLVAQASMSAGQTHVLMLSSPLPGTSVPTGQLQQEAAALLDATTAWWREWSERCAYEGSDAHVVTRSALALKLLTYEPTGAVVAAATTSLPESETGNRNWDYRYCWLRDTSLVLDAFTDLGYNQESEAFLGWLLHATRGTRPKLQVLYDVHGEADLPERVLPHLSGWRGIGPVRIGNAAAQQTQHDVYGEVIFTAWDYVQTGGALSDDEKELLADFAGVVCDIWREPDHGIWEIRLPPRHNTHSKLMCWTALDRALRLCDSQGLPIDAERVRQERDAIRADVEAHGFDERVDSYVGYYGSDAPDAAVLLIPRMGYLPARHPRMLSTVRYLLDRLMVNGLLHRYPPGSGYDGVEGAEHLFAICSFWAVECLARQDRVEEAERIYQRLLEMRNHVGLYAEEFRVSDGLPMGNFPQAFSHVGLITAAQSIQMAKSRPGGAARRM